MIPEGGTPRQVFVDDSGRRRRWTRLAGAGVTALCAAYIAVTVVGLSQTTVGPLITVPTSTSSAVTGFPDSDGSVPGLLADDGGTPAAPQVRPVAKAAKAASSAAEKTASGEARPATSTTKTSTTKTSTTKTSTTKTSTTKPSTAKVSTTKVSTTKTSTDSGRAATASRARSTAA